MAIKSEKEVLEVGIDSQEALKEIMKLTRAMQGSHTAIGNSINKVNKVNTKASKASKKDLTQQKVGVSNLTRHYKKEVQEIQNITDTLDLLQKKSGEVSDAEKSNIEDQIDLLKKLKQEKDDSLQVRAKKDDLAGGGKMIKDAGKEWAGELRDSIKSAFSRDIQGVIEGSAKTAVKSLKGLATVTGVAGRHISAKGSALSERGKEKGGLAGGAMKAGGGAMKAFGSMAGSLKPLVEGLAKVGPMLGAMGGLVMFLVKAFLDMDAKVKEFNKDLLQSSGNAQFLAQAGGNANIAYREMSDTLDGMRNAAYDLSNVEWGISPDEYKGMMNTLNQAGVGMVSLKQDADRTGQSVEAFTMNLAHVSVAYSRAFGVPIQEINQLQAEMMTNLGQNLDQTANSFHQMTRAASESGLEANTFFGIIRGVSQDLSLWGARMEDATKILGKLGQVMDPRNAQKFMQTASQGLKGMGRTERLRLTLLAGVGNTQAKNEDNFKRQAGKLSQGLGMTGKEVMDKMASDGPAGFEEAIAKMPKNNQNAMRAALQDLKMGKDANAKGTYGVSIAASGMGMGGAIETQNDAILKLSKLTSITEAHGNLAGEQAAETIGISHEQLVGNIKMAMAIKSQKDSLKKQLVNGTTEQRKAAREALKRAGIQGQTDADLAKQIDGAGYDAILDSMDESDADAAKGISEEMKLAKEQGKLQTSMLDQVGMILDVLSNTLYNVLVKIWDLITRVWGKDDHEKDVANAATLVGKNSELKSVVQAPDINSALAHSGVVAAFNQAQADVGGKVKERDALTEQLKTAPAEDKKGLEDKIGELSADIKTAADTRAIALQGFSPDAIKSAIKAAGLGQDLESKAGAVVTPDQVAKFRKMNAVTGQTLDQQFDPEQIIEILRKLAWSSASVTDKVETFGAIENRFKQEKLDTKKLATPTPPSQSPTDPPAPPQVNPSAKPEAPPAPPQVKKAASSTEAIESLSTDQLGVMKSIDDQMDKFKMDTSFLNGHYSKAVETSVLKAVRVALFEYYMYKDLKQQAVVGAMKSGGLTASTIGAAVSNQAINNDKYGADALSALSTRPANAAGGLVTGINGGLATVTAAAGEGLASVGAGERIVPKGGSAGGGTNVNISVNGIGGADLARYLETKVADGIYEYKKREKFQ